MRPPNCAGRVSSLRHEASRQGLDGILVTHEANVRYLSGFPGQDASLLITRKDRFLITDSRYAQEAEDLCGGCFAVRLAKGSLFETIRDIARRSRIRKLGFESLHLAYGIATRLKKHCGTIRLEATDDLVENIRAVKDADEIRAIKKSAALTREVFGRTAAFIKPGSSEKSIAEKIELAYLKAGARPSFPAIVASGRNTSKPHAHPGTTRIRNNSFVMVDTGCVVDGYCSDLTRMVILGRIDKRFRRIYDVVRTAQELAIARIRPGAMIADIDRAARGHIAEAGFGTYFGHALGHGVGLEIHEKPAISSKNSGLLRSGMVFTVEPAVYIPGFGGVRIEDMVLVTKTGCELLTR